MFIVTALFMTLFSSGTCMNSAYSGLSVVKHNELKNAYMNGFLAATKRNMKELEKTKKINNETLMDIVMEAGSRYIDIVEEMNSNKYSGDSKPKQTAISSQQ
ncbi:MAG: hypothetical protein ACUZ9M_04140 [Candidatus Scalindua sp.]